MNLLIIQVQQKEGIQWHYQMDIIMRGMANSEVKLQQEVVSVMPAVTCRKQDHMICTVVRMTERQEVDPERQEVDPERQQEGMERQQEGIMLTEFLEKGMANMDMVTH
jgi:hypothetical protein